MAFTNSSLAVYTNISPNRTVNRQQPITKITIHHMAGVCSLEQFDNIVKNPSRQMSSNYAIGSDGRIGLFCPEKDRSWCSSSPWNDHRSITIEVSNSAYGDASGWPISDKVYQSLINLCVDICRRNNIKQLTFTGDQNGSLTYHYMFAATGCPGPYIKGKTTQICKDVNARLNTAIPIHAPSTTTPTTTTTTTTSSFKVDDLVKINSGAKYYNGVSIPGWVVEDKWYVSSVSGDRVVLGLNEAKNRNIQSPINAKDITKVTVAKSSTFLVDLRSTDIVYATAGGVTKGTVGANGRFTIVETKVVNGKEYGKLKSGVGWVLLGTVDVEIKKGDKVKVINPIIYGSTKTFKVYESSYYVLEVNGSRVVISSDGKNVTTAIDKSNIQKI